ncbi:MAG: hemerythrin family protein, partial [SAR324 cluster bacterium]|nr:hemerythrin family protein [SAR324 cluster bacterium]
AEYAIDFNRLFDIAGGGGFDLDFIDALEKLFSQLYGFTKEHFKKEQELQQRLGIPGRSKQKFEHDKIIAKLEDFMAEIKSGRLNISLKLKSEFMEWLADHINLVDFETFRLDKIGPIVLSKAETWVDAAELVRSMGINQIDEDHQVMTEYALELSQLTNDDQDDVLSEIWDPFKKILKKLHGFAEEHFDREEKAIKKYHLKNLENMKEEHQSFLTILETHISDLERGIMLPPKKIKTEILEWWVDHINRVDYSTFKEENWAVNILSEARTWEDVSDLILSMGVESVDQQHKKQTEHILELTTLLEQYETRREDQEIFKQIVLQSEKIFQFAEKHFEHEEKMMQQMKVPNLAGHMAEHMALLDKIQDYIKNMKSGRVLVSLKLKTLLADWRINQINQTDSQSFKSERSNP